MDRGELRRFLGAVRKQRFIDYLDPLGETPMQAFERRLRWAERVWDDPGSTEEADFLLKNADELRRVLAREAAEDESADWVEGVEAGKEGGHGKIARKTSMVDVSAVGDVETPTPVPERRVEPMRSLQAGSRGAAAPGRAAPIPVEQRKTDVPDDEPMVGIMKMEDVTPVSPLGRTAPASSGASLGMSASGNVPPAIMSFRPSRRNDVPVTQRRVGPVVAVVLSLLAIAAGGGFGWWWTHRAPEDRAPTDVEASPEVPANATPPVVADPPVADPPVADPPVAAPASPPPEAPPAAVPGRPPGAQKPPRPPPGGSRPPVVPPPVVPPPVAPPTVEPPPVEPPPVAPPPVVVAPFTAKGLWTGKVGDKSIVLEVKRVDGTAITAQADVQRPDGFVHVDLIGTWNADKQSFELRDPYKGGVYRASVRDGKFVGHAIMGPGQPQVPLSLSRR